MNTRLLNLSDVALWEYASDLVDASKPLNRVIRHQVDDELSNAAMALFNALADAKAELRRRIDEKESPH